MSYYSTLDGIQKYLSELVTIGTGEADLVTAPDIAKFQADVDNAINGRLSTTYRVPLIEITRAGIDDAFYPQPIPDIANRLVAARVVNTFYKDVQPNNATISDAWNTNATARLTEIVNDTASGAIKLEGQYLIAKNRFAPPHVVPIRPAGVTPAIRP